MGEKRIITKKPPYKETVGAQYYNFNTPDEGVDFDTTKYSEETVKNEGVKTITVTESTESAAIYGSGKVYDTRQQTAYIDIEVETIATDADDLAKMRGDKQNDNGLVQTQVAGKRPYFAYGKVVELSGNNKRLDWYPKCQLVENTDEASTREESFSEQNETLTIRAYPFDEEGKLFKNSIDTSSKNYPEGVTEEMFFEAPIITPADLDELKKKYIIEVDILDGEASTNLGTKKVSDLQENIKIVNNKITGSLKHVAEFNEFSSGASGNFLCLSFPEAKGAEKGIVKCELKGTGAKTKKTVAVDEKDGLIVFQIHNKDNTIEVTSKDKEPKTLILSELELKTE